MSRTIRDPDHGVAEARFVLVGHTYDGRLVIVVHVDRVIAKKTWRFKDRCWNYYLSADGKRVSKRYVAEDLAFVESS